MGIEFPVLEDALVEAMQAKAKQEKSAGPSTETVKLALNERLRHFFEGTEPPKPEAKTPETPKAAKAEAPAVSDAEQRMLRMKTEAERAIKQLEKAQKAQKKAEKREKRQAKFEAAVSAAVAKALAGKGGA